MATLCLNMIVKNESKIILRLLQSVVHLIDCYCICDTGSTDDTVEKIQSFFNNGPNPRPGKIVFEPFQNFAHNRNVALQACQGMSDFVLLLDADMVIRAPEDSSLNSRTAKLKLEWLTTADSFAVLQGNDSFFYKNNRIVRNNGKYLYAGVTHEYINTPPEDRNVLIPKDVLFIDDVGDGGAKGNKFERDIALLLKGIEDEPKNVRYFFYLANSYHDSGKFDEAMEYYKKRIAMGDWIEEVWYSHFRLGKCAQRLGNMDAAICHWLDAYNTIPERIESLYEIIAHYRYISKHKSAFLFYEMAKKQLDRQLPREHHLFVQNDIYTYKLFVEYSILASYLGITNINEIAVRIFNSSNDSRTNQNLLSNMKFYKDILVAENTITTFNDQTIYNNTIFYHCSSSCLLPKKNGTGYWMNVRFVNYRITKKGEYLIDSGIEADETIITLNRCYSLDKDFNILHTNTFAINPKQKGKRYVGIEDIRIFPDFHFQFKENEQADAQADAQADTDATDPLVFIGTTLHENGKLGISIGKYPLPSNSDSTASSFLVPTSSSFLVHKEIEHPFPNVSCEKNWVFLPRPPNQSRSNAIVYSWYPLKIAEITEIDDRYFLTFLENTTKMPPIFQHVRGSSCGFLVPDTNEIWFVVHVVSYESPRHYYHMIVVFDLEEQKNNNGSLFLKSYSAPFKFTGEPIEYCLSIVVEQERVLMNYSVWDRSTKIGIYNREYIQSLLQYKE
jgi:tetratricopeptide (TPR) repeat protein